MSEFPAGWATRTLGEVVEPTAPIIYGILQPGPDTSGGVPYVRPSEIEAGQIDFGSLKRTTPEIAQRYRRASLRTDDVLLSIVGTIGKVALVPPVLDGANITQSSCRIRPEGRLILPEFVKQFLCSPLAVEQFDKFRLGTAVPRLNLEDVRKIEIPVPPKAEQRRIVSKIDSLSTKSRRARNHLDHVQRLVEKYKQSVLDACFTGFQETAPLFDFVDKDRGIRYGIIQTGTATQDGIPTVRCGDIRNHSIDFGKLKRVEPEIENQYRRTRLRGNEVLIAIRGSVGNTSVVSGDLVGCNISREVAMIPLKEDHIPSFFSYYLTSTEARSFITGNIKGVAQQGINLADLRNALIPVLKPTGQAETVYRIETAFAWIDRLAAEAISARKLIDHLDQAVLSKAFRGELVPPDPSDEPVSVLLERIKIERAGTSSPSRSRGRPKAVPA